MGYSFITVYPLPCLPQYHNCKSFANKFMVPIYRVYSGAEARLGLESRQEVQDRLTISRQLLPLIATALVLLNI